MSNRRLIIGAVMVQVLLLPSIALSTAPPEPTPAAVQKELVELFLIEMNQSSKEVADAIISAPQTAQEAGCLDNIYGIDLSVFQVDFTDIWGPLYDSIKDGLLGQVCTASQDWVNSQTAALDSTLALPFGLGSVTITQGEAIEDWQRVVSADVDLGDDELNELVTTDLLGLVPDITLPNAPPTTVQSNSDTPEYDSKSISDSLGGMLDVQQLWGQ